MSCDIVCFDLMATLIEDPYREAIQAATGYSWAELLRRRDPEAWPAFERGEIDESEFAARFFRDGEPFDIVTFNRVRRSGYRFLPGMRDILDGLSGRVRCVGASNYPVWIDELVARFALDRWLDGVWASCRIGVRKPDAAFYDRLLDDLGVDPARCVFIDDREANCAGAAAAGMVVHHFTGASELAAFLAAVGLADGPHSAGDGRQTPPGR